MEGYLSLRPQLEIRRKHLAFPVLLFTIALISVLLYLEWRSTRASAPISERPADTMCVAARFGLSCRS